MKILITGYRGYIGSHIYKTINKSNNYVKGIDLKDGDDILYCLPNEEFDYVLHLAAFPKVQYSIDNPSYTLKQNVFVTSKLLEWSARHNVKRFIFSSSAAVNNGKPESPYGLQKYISEMECKMYSDIYDLDTVCLRYYNVYSEDQSYQGSYSTVISSWMEMLRQGKPLTIYGDGNQTRDFIHVDDIVSANLFSIEYSDNFEGKSYDVGSGKSISLNYIKDCINEYHKVKWVNKTQKKGEIKHSYLNSKEFINLGWSPTVNIEQGLKSCFHRNLRYYI